jgi:hypothetical protein
MGGASSTCAHVTNGAAEKAAASKALRSVANTVTPDLLLVPQPSHK